MKYKAILVALLLGSLLLIPAGLFVTPNVKAHQFVQPALSVFPPDTKFFGPCLVSTYFQIDVFLWNHPLSGVDVYAFDFDISWAGISTISLVNATYHNPFAPNGFVVANEPTGPAGSTPVVSNATDWHLAITNTGLGGLIDVNMSVLTLWFHIDKDVCWPNAVIGIFALTNVSMSSDGKVPVLITNIEIDNGTYEQYSVQPNIDLNTTDSAYNATTNTITEKCNSHTFDIEVDLTNVTNVYGFDFTLAYNSSELETDAQKITFKAAFPPPYETLSVTLTHGITGQLDTISISLRRPSEKPTVCGAVVPAVDIVFHTNDTADGKAMIPTVSSSTIAITSADVVAKCPGLVTYYTTALPCTSITIPYISGTDTATYSLVQTLDGPAGWNTGAGLGTVTATISNDMTTLHVTVARSQVGFTGGAAIMINTGATTYGYALDAVGNVLAVGNSFFNGAAWIPEPGTQTWTAVRDGTSTTISFTIPLNAINIPGYTGLGQAFKVAFSLWDTTPHNVVPASNTYFWEYPANKDVTSAPLYTVTTGWPSFTVASYAPTYCIDVMDSNAQQLVIKYDGTANGPAGTLTLYVTKDMVHDLVYSVAFPPAGNFTVPIASNAVYNATVGDTIYYWLTFTADGMTYSVTGGIGGWQPYLVTLGPPTLILGLPIKYVFKPSPYDLNLDCVVDVQDLQVLLAYYAKTTVPGGYGDLSTINGGHIVDIFDFVAIAKRFGTVDP